MEVVSNYRRRHHLKSLKSSLFNLYCDLPVAIGFISGECYVGLIYNTSGIIIMEVLAFTQDKGVGEEKTQETIKHKLNTMV